VGLKRLLLLVALAAVVSLVVVPWAVASPFDGAKMGCVGEDPMTCPSGTVGQPYSLPLYILPADGKRGEDYSCATFRVTSGTFPPGLTFANDAIQGTPTQAGTFESYVTVDYPGCGKPASDQRLIISINLGVPKLTLGPESAATGTTGAPYSLQMTASVADAKTFSISGGALPPGLALDASSGLISGTPTTAGTYDFTVYAKVNADSRSDTKALEIVVRTPLTISAADPFSSARRAQGEVGIPFDATLEAAGGLGPYTWTLASGTLPSGLTLAEGAISGTPRSAGTFAFVARATDAEGRVANYPARVVVADKLAIQTTLFRPAKVGKLYGARVKTSGGVAPSTWHITAGSLPRGIRFDRATGVLSGTPRKAGRYSLTFEATDSLGVVARKTLRLSVIAAPAPKRR